MSTWAQKRFALAVRLDGAAFDPDAGPEIVRILRLLASDIEAIGCPPAGFELRDVNGNKVGKASVSERWVKS